MRGNVAWNAERLLLDSGSDTHTGFGWWVWFRWQERRASLWHLVRKRLIEVHMTVQTSWTNERHNNASVWSTQHWTMDRTDQKHNTQRKNDRDSCLTPRVLWSACSNTCVNITAKPPCSGQRGMLGRWTGRTVDDGRLDLFCWLFVGDVFCDTAVCGAVDYGERVHLDKKGSLSRSDEIFSFVTTEHIVCK